MDAITSRPQFLAGVSAAGGHGGDRPFADWRLAVGSILGFWLV